MSGLHRAALPALGAAILFFSDTGFLEGRRLKKTNVWATST